MSIHSEENAHPSWVSSPSCKVSYLAACHPNLIQVSYQSCERHGVGAFRKAEHTISKLLHIDQQNVVWAWPQDQAACVIPFLAFPGKQPMLLHQLWCPAIPERLQTSHPFVVAVARAGCMDFAQGLKQIKALTKRVRLGVEALSVACQPLWADSQTHVCLPDGRKYWSLDDLLVNWHWPVWIGKTHGGTLHVALLGWLSSYTVEVVSCCCFFAAVTPGCISQVVEGKLAWKRRLQAITMFTCDSRNAVGCGFEWGTGSCVHGVQLEVKKPAWTAQIVMLRQQCVREEQKETHPPQCSTKIKTNNWTYLL